MRTLTTCTSHPRPTRPKPLLEPASAANSHALRTLRNLGALKTLRTTKNPKSLNDLKNPNHPNEGNRPTRSKSPAGPQGKAPPGMKGGANLPPPVVNAATSLLRLHTGGELKQHLRGIDVRHTRLESRHIPQSLQELIELGPVQLLTVFP